MNQLGDCDPQAIDPGPSVPEPDSDTGTLISVIIPVFQVEQFLGHCIDSVLGQTHSNIEVILVDDGSTDDCGGICDSYELGDSRVIVIHQENRGLSAARNTGLDAARGEWITFVDSDDFVHPDMLARLLSNARSDGAALAICGFQHVEDDRTPPASAHSDRSIQLSRTEAMRAFLGESDTNMVVSWGKLYRRALFENIRFPVGRFHEDAFITHRAVWKANCISFTSEPLYFYRQRAGSITSATSEKKRIDVRDAILERADFYHCIGLSNEAIRMVQTNFWRVMRVFRTTSSEERTGQPTEIRSEVRVILRWARRLPMPVKFRITLLATYISPRAIQRFLHWHARRRSS